MFAICSVSAKLSPLVASMEGLKQAQRHKMLLDVALVASRDSAFILDRKVFVY